MTAGSFTVKTTFGAPAFLTVDVRQRDFELEVRYCVRGVMTSFVGAMVPKPGRDPAPSKSYSSMS